MLMLRKPSIKGPGTGPASSPCSKPGPGCQPRGQGFGCGGRSRMRRIALWTVGLILAGAAGFALFAYEPELAPTARPDPGSFDKALVERGRVLANYGDCTACHTQQDGRPFAGNFALKTPFGTIYTSNITPDAETGIGTWSAEAFRRSMKDGVNRKGEHLYPAFPYDHFT